VHEQRQFFHCFGCGESGDVFKFVELAEQRPFKEVLRDLARQCGVDLPEPSMTPAERQAAVEAESERERMLRAMEIATAFFEAQLSGPGGAAARVYVEKRAISSATATRFRLGYAPAGWDVLQKHLASAQVSPSIAERLGLVGTNDRGRYDFFRDRIMLPVLDRQKRPIGFSSRLLDPDAKERKYVNSPDSPLFHKKENLYGLHAALESIRRAGTAVVVEGNFDVLSLHEAGIEEAVAPMGTALTIEQVRLLGRAAKRIVVIFDGDNAGMRAAQKAIPVAVEAGLFFAEADADGRVAQMPAGVDPDDYVRANGAAAFRALIDGARPMLDHLIHEATGDPSIPGKAETARRVVEVLAKVKNPLVRDLYTRDLAAKLNVPPQQVVRMVRDAAMARGVRKPAPVEESAEPATPARRDPPRDEMDAFTLLATHPELAQGEDAARVYDLLIDPGVRQVYGAALQSLQDGGRPDIPSWLDAGPADVRESLGIALMDGRWDGVEAVGEAFRAVLGRLEKMRVAAEIAMVERQQREALARGDEEGARALSLRMMELIRMKMGLPPST
jgi:DNA primase